MWVASLPIIPQELAMKIAVVGAGLGGCSAARFCREEGLGWTMMSSITGRDDNSPNSIDESWR